MACTMNADFILQDRVALLLRLLRATQVFMETLLETAEILSLASSIDRTIGRTKVRSESRVLCAMWYGH